MYPFLKQAKQDKFKAAVKKDSAGNTVDEQTPLLVDRRNPFKPLDMDASLQNSVLKEPVLEFAAIFSSIKLLPTAVANAVPSQVSGAALAPPAAFQVCLLTHHHIVKRRRRRKVSAVRRQSASVCAQRQPTVALDSLI